MKRHYIRKHQKTYKDEKTLDGRMICNYQDCSLEFFHKKKFIEPLSVAHEINIESKKLLFTSWSNSFLGKKKSNSTIMFIFLNLLKESTSNNFKNTYFVCQHDRKDRAHRRKDEPVRKSDKIYKHGKV